MSLKKLNEIFGYGLFIVGMLKILLVILVLIQVGTNITAIFNGGSVNSEYYTTFSTTIGFAQIVLAIGSIIMIILNIKKQPEVITGYLWGIGAILLELIIPSLLSFYFVFVECGMYMKAGAKIRNKNVGSDKSHRKIKQDRENTEWFYGESNEKDKKMEMKEQKKKEKIETEILEWKKLLDTGEIDEDTYNYETNKLIEKIKNNNVKLF